MVHSLESLFNPRFVAIIGASPVPGKLGRAVAESMVAQGFPPLQLFLVNPEFAGRHRPWDVRTKYYASIAKVPETPDVAVLVIPARAVLEAAHECFERGVRNLIVISAGFSETSLESGREWERALKRLAEDYGGRIVGPNCLGIFDNVSRVDTFFLQRDLIHRPARGVVSIASQSGSFAGHLLDFCASEGQGVARAITYGNRLDIDECDALEYFARDEATGLVGLYLEGVANGRRFFASLRRCSESGKPVVALKTGRYPSLDNSVSSHTGALAGSYEAYRAAFRKAGVIEVGGLEEFVDACRALTMLPRARGRRRGRVLIVGHAGGLGLTLADHCISLGLEVPQISRTLRESLSGHLLGYASLSNPVDLTASGTDEQAGYVLEKCLARSSYFDVAIYLALWGLAQNTEKIGAIIARIISESKKPIVVASLSTPACAARRQVFEDRGIPVFPSLSRAAAVAKCLSGANSSRSSATPKEK